MNYHHGYSATTTITVAPRQNLPQRGHTRTNTRRRRSLQAKLVRTSLRLTTFGGGTSSLYQALALNSI
jgi:hypothetical protein